MGRIIFGLPELKVESTFFNFFSILAGAEDSSKNVDTRATKYLGLDFDWYSFLKLGFCNFFDFFSSFCSIFGKFCCHLAILGKY